MYILCEVHTQAARWFELCGNLKERGIFTLRTISSCNQQKLYHGEVTRLLLFPSPSPTKRRSLSLKFYNE